MYVCLCQGITDRQIRAAVEGGCCSMRELRCQLQVCSDCGKCGRTVKALLAESQGGACSGCPAAGPEPCLRQVADRLEHGDPAEREPAGGGFVRPQPVWAAARFSEC